MEWKDKIGSFRQIDVRGIQWDFLHKLNVHSAKDQ